MQRERDQQPPVPGAPPEPPGVGRRYPIPLAHPMPGSGGKRDRNEGSMTKADVHRDIEATRERMSRTIEEIDDRISGRVADIRHTADPMTQARAHPWPALLIALAAGLAIGASRAERKAAVAVVQGAKRAPGAAVSATKAAASGAGRMARSAGERLRDRSNEASTEQGNAGLFDRLRETIASTLDEQTAMLGVELERAANELVASVEHRIGGAVPR